MCIIEKEEDISPCPLRHTQKVVLKHIITAAGNTLLNNYTKIRNVNIHKTKQTNERKLATLTMRSNDKRSK